MRKLKPAVWATLALASTLTAGAQAQSLRKTYIVQLKDEPAVSYKGGIRGLAATAPTSGQSFDASRPEVQSYLRYLSTASDRVARTVAAAPVIARYDAVFNGFAARLTEDEARSLAGNAQVVGLWEDRARELDTISTAKFLGLTAPGGLWSQTVNGVPVQGENLVVGVIDGGVWPENPAFFDRVDADGVPSRRSGDRLAYDPPPAGFKGVCQEGEGFPFGTCNNKLIGARYFKNGFDATGRDLHWSDFVSPRDSVGGATAHGGHGDHTASTAAGNANVPAVLNGHVVGSASGIAPRARLAIYKVCWTFDNPEATDGSGSQNLCWDADSVAAIDAAVKDGVNVINFSISGAQTTLNDPVQQAFYRAAQAGIFVAAAAGNAGPYNQVAHASPWLTTVGASTHDRGTLVASARLGNGASYTGGSTNAATLPRLPLVLAERSGLNGGVATLCYSDQAAAAALGMTLLDPAKVAGKIVVCNQGSYDESPADKAQAVLNAGGAGLVIINSSGGLPTDAQYLALPAVHVDHIDGAAIRSYAKQPGASVELSAATYTTIPAPMMAWFSSRGPNLADANVLKPDLTAPGVAIVAQVTPELDEAQRAALVAGTGTAPPAWGLMDGTSMATPHVAGVALLLKQAHPGWGPAAIKSALMTTAYPTLDDGYTGPYAGQLPWGQGSGHIDPNRASNPGLIYDAGRNDWIKYQCRLNKALVSPATDCSTVGTLGETYELNLPSITAGAILKDAVIPRTVTNVGAAAATYTASATLEGFNVDVNPPTLTLAPGASGSFTVKLVPTTAQQGEWHYGELVWRDGVHQVRSPLQARVGPPVQVPLTDFTGTTTAGSQLFSVRTAFSGRLQTRVAGMKEVTVGPETELTPGSLDGSLLEALCRDDVSSPYHVSYSFEIPVGTVVARFELRASDVSDARDDNDLVVALPDRTTRYSGSPNSDEALQLLSPEPGTYKVCVGAYAGVAPMRHRLSSWIVGPGDGTSLKVLTPASVYAGGSATLGLSWSGLSSGKRYVGGVQYLDPTGHVAATNAIRVDTDGTVPVLNEAAATSPAKLPKRASPATKTGRLRSPAVQLVPSHH